MSGVERRTGVFIPPGAPGARTEREEYSELLTGDAASDRKRVAILLETIAAVNSSVKVEDVIRNVVDKSIQVTGDGYCDAACLPADAGAAAATLADIAARLDDGSGAPVLLLNGFDHMLPDGHVGRVADALARRNGGPVERGLLETAVERPAADLPAVHGELLGARIANLLPGAWSIPPSSRGEEASNGTQRRRRPFPEIGWIGDTAALASEREQIPSGENSKLDMLRMTTASPGTALASKACRKDKEDRPWQAASPMK